VSFGEDRDGVFKQVIAQTKSDSGQGPYKTRIKFYYATQGPLPENPDMWVHCSCPAFLYNNEVALAYHGSSEVITSNGRYPKIKNPMMDAYLCKHLVCILARAKKRKGRNADQQIAKLREMREVAWSRDRGADGINVNTLPKRFRDALKKTTRKTKGKMAPKPKVRKLKNAPRFKKSAGPGVGMIRNRPVYQSPLKISDD